MLVILLIAMAFVPDPEFSSSPLGWALYGVVVGLLLSIVIRSAISLRQEINEEKKYTVYLGKPNEPYDWAKEIDDPWKEWKQ